MSGEFHANSRSYWHKIQRSRRAKWGKKTSRLAVNTGSKTFVKQLKRKRVRFMCDASLINIGFFKGFRLPENFISNYQIIY